MCRAEYCDACEGFGLTVEAADGCRVCLDCLASRYVLADVREIVRADGLREDDEARLRGLMDSEGYIICDSDSE